MVAESFVHLLAPELVATLVSGAILLGLGYLLVDRRLQLGERADRARELNAAGMKFGEVP